MQSVFRKKTERINWRTLAAVDIDRITQQNDVRALRDNIKHVAFCDIENELELRDCDSGLLKVFKLSQLMIDYLLSSQDVLTNTVAAAEERAQIAIEEADVAKRKLQENEAFISDIKRECHRRKKLILAQQQIMDSGPNAYHRCPYCEKAFLNGSFLQLHLEKRHADRYITEWRLHREDGTGTSPRRRHSPTQQQQQVGQGQHALTSERLELLLQQLLERSMGGSGRHGGHRKTMNGGGVGSPQGDANNDSSQRSNTINNQRDRDRARDRDEWMRQMSEAVQLERDKWQDEAKQLHDEIRHLRHKMSTDKDKRRLPLATGLQDDGEIGQPNKEQLERARQKAIDNRNKKAAAAHEQVSPTRPAVTRRQDEPVRTSTDSQTRQRNAVGTSPQREISPRKTSSSPPRRDGTDRNSQLKISNMSLDKSLEISQDLVDKFCEEVRHMLDDHLELHGIPRGTTGIPGSVLNDKLKLINHGQEQMKSKYINYADIRRRLETEVNQEAMVHMKQGVPHKPTQPGNVYRIQDKPQQDSEMRGDEQRVIRTQGPVPVDRELPTVSGRSAQSSQSEWDEDSHTRVDEPQRLQHQPAGDMTTDPVDNLRHGPHYQVRNTSPRKSPERGNQLQLSSDLSNTIDSSAWKTESKAVTSIPPQHGSQAQRPLGPNRSSDYDDRSDFST